MNRNDGVAPVNQGEEYDVMIEAVGEKGDGIARYKGFVLFVAGTQVGEWIRVRVTKVLAKVGFAEKIGDAQSEKPQPRQRRERAAVSVEPEPEQHYEDSESFGDDEEDDE